MMPGIKIRPKLLFFNSLAVTTAVDSAKRAVMSRQGAFVRRAAKSLIRKRKKPSQPGQPPSSHTGMLKRNIFFSFEPMSETVIIGPARTAIRAPGVTGEPTTQILEQGGEALVQESKRRGRWRQASRRRDARGGISGRQVRKVRIAKRPYMAPALDRAMKDLEKPWKDSIKPR